ncbi:hypothetical protein COO91_09888 (plasmid) [Nostoc flagelliforme CCNUN1]|uniref:Uncharacterized protein n=1 Tax=Nostoc flagelliforme CCNUN1 TaxID=2038116 RepID=A0A2K8T7N3_9NOSO|nr:hypothetical protein COO91_09888 [Nostoc flagelliforme CCNUN1]
MQPSKLIGLAAVLNLLLLTLVLGVAFYGATRPNSSQTIEYSPEEGRRIESVRANTKKPIFRRIPHPPATY